MGKVKVYLILAVLAVIVWSSISLSGDSSSTSGAQLYTSRCASCHQANGEGIPGAFPPLKGAPAVTAQDPNEQIRIVLFGASGKEIEGKSYSGTMPSHTEMSNEQIAEVINHERTSWGNHAPTVTPEQVAAIRKEGQKKDPGDGTGGDLEFNPPKLSDAPQDIRALVQHGYNIVHETHKYAPQHVGNKLNCTNCHFDAGMVKDTLSLVGVGAVFPRHYPTVNKVIDLATITNMCFIRYLNAEPLPADSNDMLAILTYYQWISKGIPVYAHVPWLGLKPIQSTHKPNVQDGKKVYSKCAPCHGANGQGTTIAPPVWGDGAYPSGPGMGKEDVLAAFVHRFMPKGNPDLTVPQALDVSAYVLSQPRPEMKRKP